MPLTHRFKFPLPNGLHARPASHLQAFLKPFGSTVTLTNERTGAGTNARSVLSLVSADVKFDDPCRIDVAGEDEAAVLRGLTAFLRDVFPHCDEALPETPAASGEVKLPRSLKAAGLEEYLIGTAVCGGVGVGAVAVVGSRPLPACLDDETAGDPSAEQAEVDRAIAAASAALEARIAVSSGAQETGVLRAHLAILTDPALAESVSGLIRGEWKSAAQAVVAAGESFAAKLRESTSAYLRERTLDVHDVCSQLLEQLCGPGGGGPSVPVLDGPSVVVADRLTPGQFLALDRRHLRGLVLDEGGTTSHTVILARSANVPTIVGVQGASGHMRPGVEAVVDGGLGIAVTRLTDPVRRYYELEARRLDSLRRRFAATRGSAAVTADGKRVEVGVNIVAAEEVAPAVENGAEGVGLFRTEMLFMGREAPPDEEEQFHSYSLAARAAEGRPVIIRLLDVGGDKPAPYLQTPAEENPFLGFRGVRLYEEFAPVVKTQMRAVLRAADHGQVKILVPMVGCVEEVRLVKRLLAEAQDELAAAGHPRGRTPALGVMIEVPSAAFAIPDLCAEVDFFSVGSNDLTQYFLAADRANRKIARLYSWAHPAFLRLMKKIVDDVHAQGKWVGLCGEMGDSGAALPLLVGLGLDEISLSSPRIPAVKAAVGAARFDRCAKLLDDAMKCATRGEVESLLAGFPLQKGLPMLDAQLLLRPDSRTKEEVVKEMAGALQAAGRTDDPLALEEAVWQREDTYSTGFGYGFAVPHCKTDGLAASSIAVARLDRPVEWGSLDGNPVDVVVLLAVRAAEHGREHMRVFSQLSRLVMRDEFRDRLRAERDDQQLLDFLRQSLGLDTPA